ncbi:hypothetical protein D3C74_83890 [compost metagenome]
MGGEFYINRHNEHLIDQYLTNSNKSIFIDFTKDSDTLLIIFSGRGATVEGLVPPPPFEFFHSTLSMGVNRIIIRDLEKAWYHKGLSNIPDVEDFDQIVTYLEDIIPANRFNEIIVMGLSMGGYGALLFGMLTKLKVTIHSFGPQTFLDLEKKDYPDELRWVTPFLKEIPFDAPLKYLDLQNVFREKGEGLPQVNIDFHIHYGIPDRAFAERMSEFEGVYLHKYDIDVHNLPGYFSQGGQLTEVLNQLFFSSN